MVHVENFGDTGARMFHDYMLNPLHVHTHTINFLPLYRALTRKFGHVCGKCFVSAVNSRAIYQYLVYMFEYIYLF